MTPQELIANVDIHDASISMRDRMAAYVRSLQLRIIQSLKELDSQTSFKEDCWAREEGGGGISCVLQHGRIFEKAGVNVSVVYGHLSEQAAHSMTEHHGSIGKGAKKFYATGISLVLHPHNPLVPTVHANYRYFEVQELDGKPVCWWFGGGADLTPSSLIEEDAKHFHATLKTACVTHNPEFYPKFKAWCDRYFYISHRQESRGVGGIFFDDLGEETNSQENVFGFVRSCGNAFIPSYIPIVERRFEMEYTTEQKEWQQIRRGRYVEFNLVYDRGTKFGLATPGSRIESILMSLPVTARWEYCYTDPVESSPEYRLLQVVRKPIEWV